MHVASTGWFYTVPEVRGYVRQHPARLVLLPARPDPGAGAIAAAVPPAMLDWVLLPYFGWQFFHYQKQNLGLAALAAASRAGRRSLRPAERRALLTAGYAGHRGAAGAPRPAPAADRLLPA